MSLPLFIISSSPPCPVQEMVLELTACLLLKRQMVRSCCGVLFGSRGLLPERAYLQRTPPARSQ